MIADAARRPARRGALTVGLNVKDFDGFLRALREPGQGERDGQPAVSALNNEPAIMRVGTQDVFFKTTTQTDAMTGRVLQTNDEPAADYRRLVLSVTPQIAATASSA